MPSLAVKSAYAGSHAMDKLSLTGKARWLDKEKTIVSKTNAAGIITYVNPPFLEISDYEEGEVIGQPHSVIRHPHMPRCVFRILWETIGQGREIFAYVNNRTKYGDNYWVFAHVTPCYDLRGKLVGYHSSRRAPRKEALQVIEPLYHQLLEIEKQGRKEGLEASYQFLLGLLAKKKISYDEFVFSL